MYQTTISNPILRGFNPDPNVLRVGDRYYLAVSSFEWLPGVRVYTSKDLVNWQHETDLLTDRQVDLRGNPLNCSIWAPQLSYADGLFYLIYTDVKGTRRPFKDCHNYLITATALQGPWSAPVYLNSSGFDPSLFHDGDGKKWLLNEIWDYRLSTPNKSAGIVLQEYDPVLQQLTGPVHKIFDGTQLAKTEAPHIYRHADYYYLITAEGGTGAGHSVTVCRSKSLTGPYELDPQYPMLTASDKPDSPLQCAGHGSLVETPAGDWYMTYLCTRPLEGKAAVLGRETAIQEVCWSEDGWLRLADGGNGPAMTTVVKTSGPTVQQKNTNFIDDFSAGLAENWNAWRIMPADSWCDLQSRPGYLRMLAGDSPQSLFEAHILAIRQTDFDFTAETVLDYQPAIYNHMAGLILFLNDLSYLYLYVTWDERLGKVLRLIQATDGEVRLGEERISLKDSEVYLRVAVTGARGQFSYREDPDKDWQSFAGPLDMQSLSGGFTGNFVGLSVTDMDRQAGSFADFGYFKYCGLDK